VDKFQLQALILRREALDAHPTFLLRAANRVPGHKARPVSGIPEERAVQRVHGKLRQGRPKQHLARLFALPRKARLHTAPIGEIPNLIPQPSYEKLCRQPREILKRNRPISTRCQDAVSFRQRHDVSTVDRAQVSVASVGRVAAAHPNPFWFLPCFGTPPVILLVKA
jgi:hypothetical protein